MEFQSLNKSEGRCYTFFIKKTARSHKEYYRIELAKLEELLKVSINNNQDVDDLKEFKLFPCEELIKHSDKYAYHTGEESIVYKMPENFISSEILFDGYKNIPTGFYKVGGGFTDFSVGLAITDGIKCFLGGNITKIDKLVISKTKPTKLKKTNGRVSSIILNFLDLKKLSQYATYAKKQGKDMAKSSVAEFFHNKFPDASQYSMKPEGSELKKLFLSTMDESLIGRFNTNELEQIEKFFHALLGKNIKKQRLLIEIY